jgi:hypothetical protein
MITAHFLGDPRYERNRDHAVCRNGHDPVGVDRTRRRFKGKLKADSVFTANHAPDDTMKISGKLIRDRSGYAIELSFATP